MKPYLETTVLKFKDLSEQPSTKYVLLLQGKDVVPQVSVGVDSVTSDDILLRGFLDGEHSPIVTLPIHAIEFAVFDRRTFVEITRDEAIRMTNKQITDLKVLRKELDPEAAADEEKARAVEHAHLDELFKTLGKLGPAEGNGTGKPGMGQYL